MRLLCASFWREARRAVSTTAPIAVNIANRCAEGREREQCATDDTDTVNPMHPISWVYLFPTPDTHTMSWGGYPSSLIQSFSAEKNLDLHYSAPRDVSANSAHRLAMFKQVVGMTLFELIGEYIIPVDQRVAQTEEKLKKRTNGLCPRIVGMEWRRLFSVRFLVSMFRFFTRLFEYHPDENHNSCQKWAAEALRI